MSNILEQKTADELAGLQIDMLAKLRKGTLSTEQLRWFFNQPFSKREELRGKKQSGETKALPNFLEIRQTGILIPACIEKFVVDEKFRWILCPSVFYLYNTYQIILLKNI